MNKEELISKLKTFHTGDEEMDHIHADKALLEYINDPEITDAFEKIDKWYA